MLLLMYSVCPNGHNREEMRIYENTEYKHTFLLKYSRLPIIQNKEYKDLLYQKLNMKIIFQEKKIKINI